MKLNAKTNQLIVEWFKEGYSVAALAKLFNKTMAQIETVIRNRMKKAKP